MARNGVSYRNYLDVYPYYVHNYYLDYSSTNSGMIDEIEKISKHILRRSIQIQRAREINIFRHLGILKEKDNMTTSGETFKASDFLIEYNPKNPDKILKSKDANKNVKYDEEYKKLAKILFEKMYKDDPNRGGEPYALKKEYINQHENTAAGKEKSPRYVYMAQKRESKTAKVYADLNNSIEVYYGLFSLYIEEWLGKYVDKKNRALLSSDELCQQTEKILKALFDPKSSLNDFKNAFPEGEETGLGEKIHRLLSNAKEDIFFDLLHEDFLHFFYKYLLDEKGYKNLVIEYANKKYEKEKKIGTYDKDFVLGKLENKTVAENDPGILIILEDMCKDKILENIVDGKIVKNFDFFTKITDANGNKQNRDELNDYITDSIGGKLSNLKGSFSEAVTMDRRFLNLSTNMITSLLYDKKSDRYSLPSPDITQNKILTLVPSGQDIPNEIADIFNIPRGTTGNFISQRNKVMDEKIFSQYLNSLKNRTSAQYKAGPFNIAYDFSTTLPKPDTVILYEFSAKIKNEGLKNINIEKYIHADKKIEVENNYELYNNNSFFSPINNGYGTKLYNGDEFGVYDGRAIRKFLTLNTSSKFYNNSQAKLSINSGSFKSFTNNMRVINIGEDNLTNFVVDGLYYLFVNNILFSNDIGPSYTKKVEELYDEVINNYAFLFICGNLHATNHVDFFSVYYDNEFRFIPMSLVLEQFLNSEIFTYKKDSPHFPVKTMFEQELNGKGEPKKDKEGKIIEPLIKLSDLNSTVEEIGEAKKDIIKVPEKDDSFIESTYGIILSNSNITSTMKNVYDKIIGAPVGNSLEIPRKILDKLAIL